MFSSIFSALSGMVGFSKGLDVISNNVANMNTPGFKAAELEFRDIFYRYGLTGGSGGGSETIGQGLDTGSTRVNFRQGELRETSSGTDLAIDGNGFFVLQKDGEVFYTRNGQFVLNEQGLLVDSPSGARVAAYTGTGLADISLAGLRMNPPNPTTEVTLLDTLNHGSTSHELSNVAVIDAAGGSHTLSLRFTRTNDATLNSARLSTTDTTRALSLNSTPLSTTRTTTTTTAQPLNGAALSTTRQVTTTSTTYTIQTGDTWASIATALYGSAQAATQLQTAVGPVLTVGNDLSGFPASITVTTTSTQTVPPYYAVQASDSWASIATALYGSAEGASVLQSTLGDPALGAGVELAGLPATLDLSSPVTVTVPAYYTVQSGDTWDSIARHLYGYAFGSELQASLGDPTLTAGTRLTGFQNTLTLSTSMGTVHRWVVEAREGTTTVGTGEVRYAGTGSPLDAFANVAFDYAPSGASSSRITLNFSETQSLSTSQSTVRVSGHDGYAAGSLIESTFDDSGRLTLKYSNAQTVTHSQLAIASFSDLQTLTAVGGNLFIAAPGQTRTLGTANSEGLGKISAKHIELSNVELTEQFTDIVIVQRGYQASSQVISVANEMAQQLMDLRR